MKQLLEPIQPLVVSLQSKLIEVQFEFKKTEKMIYMYEKNVKNVSERFRLVCAKAASLSNKFGTEEK